MLLTSSGIFSSFFFNDTATTEIYTLSLHDALPISIYQKTAAYGHFGRDDHDFTWERTDKAESLRAAAGDRKSTRLNSSHSQISYAVFCLKKKKNIITARSEHSPHLIRISYMPMTDS